MCVPTESCKLLANAKWTDIRTNACNVVHSSGHVNSRTDEGAALDWHCQCLLPVHDNDDDAPDDNDSAGEHDVDVDGDGDGDADDDGEDNENDNINVSIANVLPFL